jgi:hypothetical protein
LSSKTAKVEDRFEATTMVDVRDDRDRVLIPAGSMLRGVVSSVNKAGRIERQGKMTLAFDQVTVKGRDYPFRATVTQALESEGIRGEAGKIGAGAGVGAIIGGILGGFKGAMAGILIGGGGTIAATEGKDVELPRERCSGSASTRRWICDRRFKNSDLRIQIGGSRVGLGRQFTVTNLKSEIINLKFHPTVSFHSSRRAPQQSSGRYPARCARPIGTTLRTVMAVDKYRARACRGRSGVHVRVRSRGGLEVLTGRSAKKGVSSEPNALTCRTTPVSRAASARPAASRLVSEAICVYRRGFSWSRHQIPAVIASGLPDSVPAW